MTVCEMRFFESYVLKLCRRSGSLEQTFQMLLSVYKLGGTETCFSGFQYNVYGS